MFELIDYGFIFKTESDTEVFLYGLIHFGIEKFLILQFYHQNKFGNTKMILTQYFLRYLLVDVKED